MSENQKSFKELRRQALDDTFDVFTMLAQGNIVSVMDVDGNETRYTPNAVELFGLSGEYIPNGAMDWSNWVHPDDRKHYETVMGRLITGESNFYDLSYRVLINDGRYSLFRVVGGIIRGDSGKPSMIGGMMINEGLQENTDPITVMRNQDGFFADLADAMRAGETLQLLYLGLNNLQAVNDTYGYSSGNHVMQEAGMLLQNTLGDQGTVYRMEGAKFAVLSTALSPDGMADYYERVKRKLQTSIQVAGVRHNLAASGGMLSVHGMQTDARTIFTSLRYAYGESKTRMHGALVNFDSNHSLEMILTLRSSVIDNCRGFSLAYQPVVNAETEKIFGVEAFARWEDETYGRLGTMQFLPVLEQDAVFEELGIWILRQAMRDGLRFLEKDPAFIVGVNISAVQLEKDYFADMVMQVVAETGFPAENLCLELTKDCRLLSIERLREVTEELRKRKIRIAIDDFGAGASSFESVRELKAELVKLDPSLVADIEHSETDRAALQHIAELASVYGSNVCVKCVESVDVLSVLKRYPVRSIQGYLFGRPLPFEEILHSIEG